jgi:hypothetical protein
MTREEINKVALALARVEGWVARYEIDIIAAAEDLRRHDRSRYERWVDLAKAAIVAIRGDAL